MVLNENVKKKIIPIAGGKGGVGKSLLAVNLAVSLALNYKKVILIDFDLGGSNLHTLLGFRNNNIGIGNYLSNNRLQFEDIILGTPYDNLYFIPGDVQVFGSGDISFPRLKKILKAIPELPADYIILDLGAGTHNLILDLFLISNSGIIISTPQNTSIANAHSFLKNVSLRFLQRAFDSNKSVSQYFKKNLKEIRPGKSKNIKEIISELALIDSDVAEKAEVFLEVLQPKIIINMIREPEDYQVGNSLSQLVERDFLINLECLGMITYEPDIDQSIIRKKPYLFDHPDSLFSRQIHRIVQKIVQSEEYPFMPFDYSIYKNSFELAFIEAEYDFQELNNSYDEFLNEDGSYNIEQMLEIINNQQNQIKELEERLSHFES